MSVRLIVGLGNPGREYTRTRHNVGFMGVTALAERWGLQFNRQRHRAEVAEGNVGGKPIILAKPQTFMNQSGDSVRPLLKMSNLEPSDLLVLYDEMDLPFGRLRLRDQGSAGGHRGLQSIIDRLGTNKFARLRIGVGRPPDGIDPIDYVLRPFTASELADLTEVFDRAFAGIDVLLNQDIVAAMNLINAQPRPAAPTTAAPPSTSQ